MNGMATMNSPKATRNMRWEARDILSYAAAGDLS
jgi:hypothetical protein